MKVTVMSKNIEITPALREVIEKKISKLDKYFEKEVDAKVTISVQKNRHIVEVTIPFSGIMLRAEEATEDMYKSIDMVEEKLVRQIRKQKTKLSRKYNQSLRFAEIATDLEEVEETKGKIVRTKTFAVKPMNSEEAVLQMELLGHNFFVYQDTDTNNISVLYKRKDGNYGLLDPEYK
ncbi:ribosome hibernation-promoting factor, HPF/YfiA family [Clostridium thermobutyricum]|uniref:Ribosome hibernation promoting factor n=1 Tax=Clostridium thermobutyricum DSM 4928 TaxID=1121339 RepID=A0A1V4SX76_9CLOT|nr:ribosome-associated translation inhibitor RaiA [Clostridium thermobutyricum]OPX49066.1 ribosome-associated factor Y [Clostridium thermobutyricum DSM 4928]